MAGHIFNDPRPFYSMTADLKYSYLDDVFGPGKKENKFIESEYLVKELGKPPHGSNSTGHGAKTNTKKGSNNNNNEGNDSNDEQKKKAEEKSKIQTVELNVSLCCDSCVWQVEEALEDIQGVEKVDCDQINKKVWVKGSVKPEVVLKKVRKIKKDAKLVEKEKKQKA